MPHAQTVSIEWIEAREDELARLITANEHIERFRVLAAMLHKRGIVTNSYFHDMLDSLDFIAAALQTGKRNTAKLRNGDRE